MANGKAKRLLTDKQRRRAARRAAIAADVALLGKEGPGSAANLPPVYGGGTSGNVHQTKLLSQTEH